MLDEMKRTDDHNFLFPNVRWNEKNDVIIFCFPILDEMKRMTSYCLFPNIRWNEKNDDIIFCLPMLDEMKRLTS